MGLLYHGGEGHDAALYANYTVGDSPEKSIRAMFPKASNASDNFSEI